MESDQRFFKRRASEELAAARRAVTSAARDRRLQLATTFLQRLELSKAENITGGSSNPAKAVTVKAPSFADA